MKIPKKEFLIIGAILFLLGLGGGLSVAFFNFDSLTSFFHFNGNQKIKLRDVTSWVVVLDAPQRADNTRHDLVVVPVDADLDALTGIRDNNDRLLFAYIPEDSDVKTIDDSFDGVYVESINQADSLSFLHKSRYVISGVDSRHQVDESKDNAKIDGYVITNENFSIETSKPVFAHINLDACDGRCYTLKNQKLLQKTYQSLWEQEIVPYISFEGEDITFTPPSITKTTTLYETVPIMHWEYSLANEKKTHDAFRIFVSSTKEKLDADEADIFDSGKIWSDITHYAFVPEIKIDTGIYYWKVVLYEYVNDNQLVSPWSQTGEIDYKPLEIPSPNEGEVSQTGWIPSWGYEEGLESLQTNQKVFDRISPVWFDAVEDGSLTPLASYNNEDFISYCEDNDILVIPSIAQFDPEILAGIADGNIDKHVEAIITEVDDGKYDGIDIDYEATYLDDKEAYFEFLEKLSAQLHERSAILSVTVLPQWSDYAIYPSLSQTREVQDWTRIAALADEVRIMAYDYYFQSSYEPGPISPYYWDQIILEHALKHIPAEKIVLALPLYAYSFRIDEQTEISTDIFDGGERYGNERRVYAYTFSDIRDIADIDDFEWDRVYYNNYSHDKVYEYFDGTNDRVMYFNDYQSNQDRLALAKAYGIKGVAYWKIGGDDERNYEVN